MYYVKFASCFIIKSQLDPCILFYFYSIDSKFIIYDRDTTVNAKKVQSSFIKLKVIYCIMLKMTSCWF